MRILHIIGSMDPSTGGTYQSVLSLSREMIKLGCDVEILCFDESSYNSLANEKIIIHTIGGRRNPWNYNPHLDSWLKDNVIRFDGIITNGLWLYHSYAVCSFIITYRKKNSKRKKIGWYIMPHGMLDPYFQSSPSRKWKSVRNNIYWKLIEQRVIKESDGILFTSEIELQLARKTFQRYSPKIELNIGLGIELPPEYKVSMKTAFLERCSFLSNSEPYLLFLSRLHPKKGIELLLYGYNRLMTTIGHLEDSLPKLIIAGPCVNDEYQHFLTDIVESSPALKKKVHFTGMLSGDSKWGALYGCETLILPSYQENFGIVIAEALACAKPVLISNQINIHEDVDKEKAGLVSEVSVQGVQEMLFEWFSTPVLKRNEMSKNAKSLFINHYTIEKSAERVIQILLANMNL